MEPTSTTTSIGVPTAPGDGQDESSLAGQAQAKASELAGQVQENAQQATGQAKGKLREQIDQRSQQAAQQVNQQASDLRAVSESLREQGKEGPANVAGKVAEYAERLGEYLRDKDPDALLADAEEFGRRKPWAVAAGGLALGFATSRLLKASSSRRYSARFSPAAGGPPPRPGSYAAAPVTPPPTELPIEPVESPRTPLVGPDVGV